MASRQPHPIDPQQLRITLEIAAGLRGSIRYHPHAGLEHQLYHDALTEIRRLDERIDNLTAELAHLTATTRGNQ